MKIIPYKQRILFESEIIKVPYLDGDPVELITNDGNPELSDPNEDPAYPIPNDGEIEQSNQNGDQACPEPNCTGIEKPNLSGNPTKLTPNNVGAEQPDPNANRDQATRNDRKPVKPDPKGVQTPYLISNGKDTKQRDINANHIQPNQKCRETGELGFDQEQANPIPNSRNTKKLAQPPHSKSNDKDTKQQVPNGNQTLQPLVTGGGTKKLHPNEKKNPQSIMNGQQGDVEKTSPTAKDIKNSWNTYFDKELKGIKDFYTDDNVLDEQSKRAAEMVKRVVTKGCTTEKAMQLTLLALYDLVLLVDNSHSMEIAENGKRIDTLKSTLILLAGIYDLVSRAENGGLVGVKFLNSPGCDSIKPGQVEDMVKTAGFMGLTRIGTALREKVLKPYADVEKMIRPLLVIIITNGEIEGEDNWVLRDVIVDKALELKRKLGDVGPQAVRYQFAAVGDDQKAHDLLKKLDDDPNLGDYIDCLNPHQLEEMHTKPEEKWQIVPKLLLGAIMSEWDEDDLTKEPEPDAEKAAELGVRKSLAEPANFVPKGGENEVDW